MKTRAQIERRLARVIKARDLADERARMFGTKSAGMIAFDKAAKYGAQAEILKWVLGNNALVPIDDEQESVLEQTPQTNNLDEEDDEPVIRNVLEFRFENDE